MSSLKIDERLYGQQKLHPMISSTPNPSAIFSTTSSSESCGDGDSDGQRIQEDDYDIYLKDHDDWIEGDYEKENERGLCEDHEAESPRGTSVTKLESKPKVSYFWKRRIAELFVIQITLLTSIVLFFQCSNVLSVTSATVVSGSETIALPSWKNAVATVNDDITIGDAESRSEDCIYVPGGGFSGFWFSLGRLQSIQHPHNETFVCYSAGCLGVVATLLHHGELLKYEAGDAGDAGTNNDHYHHVYEMARSIQVEWETGKRHRYRVVESFIDGLLEKLEEDPNDEWKELFLDTIRHNLNIVTTAFDEDESSSNLQSPQFLPPSIVPRAFVRRPSDIPSLKRLLLQSAWIPVATGSSWTHKGHMDGSFSMAQHPKCSRTVGLEVSAPATAAGTTNTIESTYSWLRKQVLLWANTLNIDLSREDVGALWKIGMEHGV